MNDRDRRRWDQRYRHSDVVASIEHPRVLDDFLHLVPTTGNGLDIACGRGQGALWMASAGLSVLGVDISPVAIARAREGAQRLGLTHRCRFQVHDLDRGLPAANGSPEQFDMIFCRLFRAPQLYAEMARRLAPGGLLSIVTLAEDGPKPGRHRASADELPDAFRNLTLHGSGHGDGRAWLVATKPMSS